MTVKELYDWCRSCRHKDAEVYICKDWLAVDDEGNLTELYPVTDITMQCVIVDLGMDFEDEYQAIIEVSDSKA